jgi:hypothetical protein
MRTIKDDRHPDDVRDGAEAVVREFLAMDRSPADVLGAARLSGDKLERVEGGYALEGLTLYPYHYKAERGRTLARQTTYTAIGWEIWGWEGYAATREEPAGGDEVLVRKVAGTLPAAVREVLRLLLDQELDGIARACEGDRCPCWWDGAEPGGCRKCGDTGWTPEAQAFLAPLMGGAA